MPPQTTFHKVWEPIELDAAQNSPDRHHAYVVGGADLETGRTVPHRAELEKAKAPAAPADLLMVEKDGTTR
jgi:hypothetical protein